MKTNTLVFKNCQSDNVSNIHYPDGQQSVEVNLSHFDVKIPIVIKASIRNFKELELFLCIVQALRHADRIISCVQFIYLFGMRSDRSFEEGQPNYFRDVLAPIINNLNIPSIEVLMGHSELSKHCLNNLDYCQISVGHEIPTKCLRLGGDESYGIQLHFKKERKYIGIICYLEADTLFHVKQALEGGSEILIMDDLCDGGATFIKESQYLKMQFPNVKINLFIMHALFTKGIDHVAEHFDHIYCSNSYQDIDHPKVTQIKVI